MRRTHGVHSSTTTLIATNIIVGYLASKDVDLDNPSDDSRAQALAILQEFASQLPKAATPRRMALSFANRYVSSFLNRALRVIN